MINFKEGKRNLKAAQFRTNVNKFVHTALAARRLESAHGEKAYKFGFFLGYEMIARGMRVLVRATSEAITVKVVSQPIPNFHFCQP